MNYAPHEGQNDSQRVGWDRKRHGSVITVADLLSFLMNYTDELNRISMSTFKNMIVFCLLVSVQVAPAYAQERGEINPVVLTTVTTVDPKLLDIDARYLCVFEYGGTFRRVSEEKRNSIVNQRPNGKLFLDDHPKPEFDEGWIKVYLVKKKDYQLPGYRFDPPRSFFAVVKGRMDGTKAGERMQPSFISVEDMLAEKSSKSTIRRCNELAAEHWLKARHVAKKKRKICPTDTRE